MKLVFRSQSVLLLILVTSAINIESVFAKDVIQARYGVAGQFFDVTAVVKEKITNGSSEITVANQNFSEDPAPGKLKLLIVTYRDDSGLQEISFHEGETVQLPDLKVLPKNVSPFLENQKITHQEEVKNIPEQEFSFNIDDLKHRVESVTVTIEYNQADRAAGATGFLVEFKGQKYILTNIHVLEGEATTESQLIWSEGPRDYRSGIGRISHLSRLRTSYDVFQKQLVASPLPKIKTTSGDTLQVSPSLLLSEARDIALIPVKTDLEPLLISDEPPKSGQDIFVLGNPEAEHTLVVLDGKIDATGPERLELRCIGELKQGMSGGAVVNSRTGKVIGAIAYAVRKIQTTNNKFDVEQIFFNGQLHIVRVSDRFERVVRNFAFRIDNIGDFQSITWEQFLKDCGALHAMNERSLNIARAAQAPYINHGNEQMSLFEIPPDFNSSVNILYSSSINKLRAPQKQIDFNKKWLTFQSMLQNLLNQDMSNPQYKIKTPYIRRMVEQDVFSDRQYLATKLRSLSGKFPSSSE